MTKLERKKKELEMMKVQCAREEMLFRIEEALEQIERLKQNVAGQDARISELKQELETE